MTKALVSALALALPVLFIATPSFATKGIDAARTCEAKPGCHVEYYDDGSIIIVVGGTFISCSGPQAECTVLIRRGLGTINPAALGTHTVQAMRAN